MKIFVWVRVTAMIALAAYCVSGWAEFSFVGVNENGALIVLEEKEGNQLDIFIESMPGFRNVIKIDEFTRHMLAALDTDYQEIIVSINELDEKDIYLSLKKEICNQEKSCVVAELVTKEGTQVYFPALIKQSR